MLNFWYCVAPCRKEMPMRLRAHEDGHGGTFPFGCTLATSRNRPGHRGFFDDIGVENPCPRYRPRPAPGRATCLCSRPSAHVVLDRGGASGRMPAMPTRDKPERPLHRRGAAALARGSFRPRDRRFHLPVTAAFPCARLRQRPNYERERTAYETKPNRRARAAGTAAALTPTAGTAASPLRGPPASPALP